MHPKRRVWRGSIIGAASLALLARADDYQWTGGATSDDWDLCGNWNKMAEGIPDPFPSAPPCYPQDADDRAIIGGTWAVETVTEEIKQLTLWGDVTFTGATASPVLQVERLLLVSPTPDPIVIDLNDVTITSAPSGP